MASLQQGLTSLPSNHIHHTQTPRNFLTYKPLLNFSFSGTTFPSLKLKFVGAATTRPSNGGLGAKMVATAASSYAQALADVPRPTIPSTPQPLISRKSRKSSLINNFQPHTRSFLNILVDAKRTDLIKEITKEFEYVYDKLTNTELAVVSSVVKLESEHLSQIAKQVQKLTGAKNVRIKTVIDPSLVAGFTIRYGNSGSKLIDMSVKKQLDEIAAQLDLGDIKLAVRAQKVENIHCLWL
ncbi:hypothetical protein L6164_010945 [Bauhinia variegata]|uniref:Uncharacterized protein n=1 Tax=Bauhinia variegata TaxID=167791 RepID=A0ACB9P6Y1_BAUVA|nr:hypothetical protein L6164_010945 [Bauhinia variegata]